MSFMSLMGEKRQVHYTSSILLSQVLKRRCSNKINSFRKNRQPVKDRCSLVILYTLLLCPTFWVLLHVCWGVEGGGWQWCHVMLTSMKNQNVRWLELSSHIKVINGFKSYSPFINSEVILNEKCFHFLFFSKNMGATISP